ncbi:hypothetical protein, partial [Paraburkholderia sp. SIMBA_030]|uniref:hypothetical protein n=1 Tax=Paraburkholderia sp. SIMBA_030 TaxID=3085773 RepID=UPI0039795AAA
AKSGRTIEQVAKNPDDTWNSKPNGRKAAARLATKAKAKPQAHQWPKGVRKAAMPDFVEPVLAKLKPRPPAGDGWIH